MTFVTLSHLRWHLHSPEGLNNDIRKEHVTCVNRDETGVFVAFCSHSCLSAPPGKVCSFEQLEHVREMQEKLARLHFSLDSHVEELSEDQKKSVSDHNLEHLLSNVRSVPLATTCRSCSSTSRAPC